MLTFPDGFLWGAATAAHQVEGNNVNSNWWAMEIGPLPVATLSRSNFCNWTRRLRPFSPRMI